jgi:hypothetical protein
MKMIYLYSFFIYLALAKPMLSQKSDILFSRLQAITNSGVDFYNVDGINITSQYLNIPFNVKSIAKKYKKYSIKADELGVADSTIPLPNFYVFKTEEVAPTVTTNTSYYFIEKDENKVLAITFGSSIPQDRSFERKFINLVLYNQIPQSVFASGSIDSINFAGRYIKLGGACRWMSINNMQCPYNGQMNWSVHKTLASASADVEHQYQKVKHQKGGKIISEEIVKIIFEGNRTTARKVTYDIKGINSFLVSMTGGKTLTIYFVASAVRQHYVSCVLSHWNNDKINSTGLVSLMEEVMQLDK